MQTYDLVMLAVLLIATTLGAFKGLAWQIASLAAICASYVVAYSYRHAVAAWLPAPAPWNVFLAMLALYMATSLGIWILFRLVSRLIDRVKLKQFDRQFGAVLGLTKGAILCVIITLFAVTLLGEKQRQAIVKSKSGYYIAVLLNKAPAMMPEEIREVLSPVIEAWEQRLEEPVGEAPETGGGDRWWAS